MSSGGGSSSDGSATSSGDDHNCVDESYTVLLLDEQLQQIPVECIPMLRAKRCSRVPSLPLFLRLVARAHPAVITHHPEATGKGAEKTAGSHAGAKAVAAKTSAASTAAATGATAVANAHYSSALGPRHERCWYAIDPEKNLATTRATMVAFLEPYIARWAWRGFVAEIPPEETMRGLHGGSDLFIYCGHGAGEKMCETHKMRHWSSLPAALLWGCSSGRLATLGVHDPYGAALNYLLGGAPYVVGNMWDVTDKDIDKLSKECMRVCFDAPEGVDGAEKADHTDRTEGAESADRGVSVTQALVQSRGVCKMKFAVGCAPVVYGYGEY